MSQFDHQHIKNRRNSLGLTQKQVAEQGDISLSYYTEIELGKKRLNEKTAKGIARALGWTVADVFSEEPRQSVGERISSLKPEDQELVIKLVERLEE